MRFGMIPSSAQSISGGRHPAIRDSVSEIAHFHLRYVEVTLRCAATRTAPRKNYGKCKDIDHPAHGLEGVAAMAFLFRSIRLERIEHERRRTSHALQVRIP